VTGLTRGDGSGRPGGTASGAIVALAAVATALMFSAPAAAEVVHDGGPVAIQVHAKPINLFLPREQDQIRFGALEFRGGLELTSDYREFGGFSAPRMDPDGEHFVSLSDKSFWLTGRIVYDRGRPAGIDDAEMAPVLGPEKTEKLIAEINRLEQVGDIRSLIPLFTA